jgi:excisionase family DNA binding protein
VTKMLLSKKEFADAVGISVRTADNLIACKEISVRRIGRRVLISISEVETFAKRDHATKPRPNAPTKDESLTAKGKMKSQLSKSTVRTNGKTEEKLKESVNESHSPQHLPQQ